jgi:hypothetical protein
MQDRAVVAAVVAGDADGFAAAYDQYAASLYAYCHSVLPGPEAAAEAVLDTFLVAAAKLDGLRDPDRLGSWLHAVARNECLRRLGPEYAAGGAQIPGSADLGDEPPAVTLPGGFRGKVLTACADSSPAGRAHRMSVAHRAGAFGPAGFPKPAGPSGPRWWRRVRRHPGVVAAVAVVVALAMVTGITVIMTAGSSQRPQASGLRLGAGGPGPASSAAPASTSAAPSPARKVSASAHPTPSATMPASAASPQTPAGRGTPQPSVPLSHTPSPSPSPSTSPAQGHLLVAPDMLLLTSKSGKPASGSFVLTAANGPVAHYTVRVPAGLAGKVRVAPTGGSLPAGGYVDVTVTVTSKVALTTHVIVAPGNLTVTVVYKVKDLKT